MLMYNMNGASLAAQLVKNPPASGRPRFDPWAGKIPWRRERLPTAIFWLGEFHGLYSRWSCKELDTTEWLALFIIWKVAQLVKNLPALPETWVRSLDWEDPLDKGRLLTRRQWHPTPVLLPWKIPWTGEPGSDFTFTSHFQVLEKEMATHSSILAWRIPGMGEPGGSQSQTRLKWCSRSSTHSSILAREISWTEEPGRLQSNGLQCRTRLSDWVWMDIWWWYLTSCIHIVIFLQAIKL